MTEEQIALGRRAVACNGWRWMPGMLTHDGFRTVWSADGLHQSFKLDGYEAIGSTEQLIPDLSDPATLGCLLALVREAWDIPLHLDDTGGRMVTIQSGPGGSTLVIDKIDAEKDRKVINGWRDVSVFVAALEAAP